MTQVVDQVVMIPLDSITGDIGDIRSDRSQEKIEEMRVSLRENGQTDPIFVKSDGRGGFLKVTGFTRVLGALALGWTEIKAIVLPDDISSLDLLYLQVRADVTRDNLNALDEGRRYSTFLAMGETIQQIAVRMGKSGFYVQQRISVYNDPDARVLFVNKQANLLEASQWVELTQYFGEPLHEVLRIQQFLRQYGYYNPAWVRDILKHYEHNKIPRDGEAYEEWLVEHPAYKAVYYGNYDNPSWLKSTIHSKWESDPTPYCQIIRNYKRRTHNGYSKAPQHDAELDLLRRIGCLIREKNWSAEDVYVKAIGAARGVA